MMTTSKHRDPATTKQNTVSLKSYSLTKLCSRFSSVLCAWFWNKKGWWSRLGGNNQQSVLEGDLRLKCGRLQRDLGRDFFILSLLLVKRVLVLQAGASSWNGSEYFFRHMSALKPSCSLRRAAKMVLPGSLGFAKLLFSWNSPPHFPQRDANKKKSTMYHEFLSCGREKEATQGIPIQSSSGPNSNAT